MAAPLSQQRPAGAWTKPWLQAQWAEKECIWARAYDRLKAYGEEESMLQAPVVFGDSALCGTSAWANAFLKKDHTGKSSTS